MNDIFVVPLRNSDKICIIDADDKDHICNRDWYIISYKNIYSRKVFEYACSGRNTFLHKLIQPSAEKNVTDHINRNTFDNRRSNLRSVSQGTNTHNGNKQKNTTSKFRGVYFDATRSRWYMEIKYKKKRTTKIFNTENEAALAYNFFAQNLYGDCANLNPICL